MSPKLSIVLGTLDRPQAFEGLLKTVLEYTKGVDWEMVVADAGINKPLQKDAYPSNVHVIRESPRQGHAVGYNRAFWEATGEWVIWLNDDCEVEPQWAINAIHFMERNPWVGLGALFYCNYVEPFFCNEYQGMPYANFGIIKREYGNGLRWFDEVVDMYGADNSLAFKVYMDKKVVRGIPLARVIHRPYHDSYRLENEAKQAQDAALLMRKYAPFIDDMLKVHREFEQMRPK